MDLDWDTGARQIIRVNIRQIITVRKDKADTVKEEARVEAIIIDLSRPFDSFPYDWLLIKIAASTVDSRIVLG
jgi:hypothetical protein